MEKAILKLAVAVVSPIIGKLIEKLSASYLGGDVTFEEIKKLHTIILPQIHIAIKATEEIPIDKLKPWLMDLKAAAFEAEDVLDLYEYKVIENKLVNPTLLKGMIRMVVLLDCLGDVEKHLEREMLRCEMYMIRRVDRGGVSYGVLLQNFETRNHTIPKIGGCVVDFAPCAEISPQEIEQHNLYLEEPTTLPAAIS